MNTLIEYVRVKRGKYKGMPRGVVVATAKNVVGWSFTNLSHGDKFDKETGIMKATCRANGNVERNMPHDVKSVFERMKNRSVAYFKS